MRKPRPPHFICLLSLSILVFFTKTVCAQENKDYLIRFRSGAITPGKNITPAEIAAFNKQVKAVDNKAYLVIQFENIPAEAEKEVLANEGIKLLEYIPAKSYICEITPPLSFDVLKKYKARAIIVQEATQKTDPQLYGSGEEEVMVAFYSSFSYKKGIASLKAKGFSVQSEEFSDYNMVKFRLPLLRLAELASFPFIQYIEKGPPPPVPLNFKSRNFTRANLLQTNLPGGYGLTGEGVVVGVNEVTGAPFPHVDYADRLISGSSGPPNGYHSTHVNGTVGAAGLIYELYKGYAPKATLYGSGGIGSSAPIYLQTYGMVITNNSVGSGGPCSPPGVTILQALYDQQATRFPVLQNVFGTGNSGNMSCTGMGYPFGFHTTEGSQASAKSVICVGNTMSDGQLFPQSSKGPTYDGRIKPELVATGTAVISTIPGNVYGVNTGTSMSSPAVAGGLALLYQRYKQLHNEQNPNAALMKAILCNTATDVGNAGPDFSYGFGHMNLYRAVKTIDANRYFLDSVTHQGTRTSAITVGEGTAQLKVLLYWQDPAPSVASSQSLVNDLDITVTSSAGTTVFPYRLDTTAANVANPATRGEDHVNNIEQVVIDFPQAGTYSIKVKGTEVGQNPQQEYYITYDLLPDSIMLTFPFGSEAMKPGEILNIQWDSWGADNSTFKLEFSPDSGSNWQTINAAVAADKRQFDWTIPNNIYTGNALIRITRNSDLKTSASSRFVIIGEPLLGIGADQCPGFITLQWTPVAGASYYEVMKIQNGEMIVVDTSSSYMYTIKDLSPDSVYWVTARAVINHFPGRRALALSKKPDFGNCINVFFDNNLKADSLLAPLTGRQFTSSQLSSTQHIVLRIKNLDDQPVNNFSVSYSINNNNWVTENFNTTLAPGSAYTYSSAATYDFSQPGQYLVKVAVHNSIPDPDTKNDSLQYIVRYLPNPPVDLTVPSVEKFEQATDTIYNYTFQGLKGADRFDYKKNSRPTGQTRFPFNELSDTSGKSLKLDFTHIDFVNGFDQSIVATYNLAAYDTTANSIGLNFTYGASSTTCIACVDDIRLYIRGNDTRPWIAVPPFNATVSNFNNRKIEGIELGNILAAAGQNFSSSFQLMFSHLNRNNKYIFDDITLYNATNEIILASIDSLRLKNCNLGTVPVSITIKNASKNMVTNVQVQYKIDNGNPVTELISSIPANTSLPYTFVTPANLSTTGFHTIEAWATYPNDPNTANNLKKITLRNQPLVNSMPYLENFENSDGSFYTDGTNSSWEYGRPASTLINQAASGNAAWKTNLDGKYNNNESSFLYSPCIDISSLQNPIVSISLALNIDSCITPTLYCDYMRVQYSTDGTAWNAFIGPIFRYNWPPALTSRSYYRWHVASLALPANQTKIQFRFQLVSNQSVNYEGAAIDDFHIYDRKALIYDTLPDGNVLQQPVTGGNNWVDFLQNQKIVASINPYGQNLGNTIVKPYIAPAQPVSNFHGQYYLNRTFVITSANKNYTDSIGVRLYFMDNEADSLLFAGNCPNCYKPVNAYRFGISHYSSDSLSEINNIISDNINGHWSFIESSKVKIIPYDRGYYAEFKVKDLAEFRLNSGGQDKKSYLPANLLSLTAVKSANNVTDLSWTIASEINISRYEIEVAKGNDAFVNNQFNKIGEQLSPGPTAQNRLYTFADISPNKNGAFYYRLKIIDEFGNYIYSRVIPVLNSKELNWTISPNPSRGFFTMLYQLDNGENARVHIYNAAGQLVKTQNITGSGYVQTTGIDMTKSPFQRGMYLLKVSTGSTTEVFKLIIQ